MTVKELITALSQFSPDTEVLALWDATPNFTVHGVYRFDGKALIDCADSEDGNWHYFVDDPRAGK